MNGTAARSVEIGRVSSNSYGSKRVNKIQPTETAAVNGCTIQSRCNKGNKWDIPRTRTRVNR